MAPWRPFPSGNMSGAVMVEIERTSPRGHTSGSAGIARHPRVPELEIDHLSPTEEAAWGSS
jgi:hypothetical protein